MIGNYRRPINCEPYRFAPRTLNYGHLQVLFCNLVADSAIVKGLSTKQWRATPKKPASKWSFNFRAHGSTTLVNKMLSAGGWLWGQSESMAAAAGKVHEGFFAQLNEWMKCFLVHREANKHFPLWRHDNHPKYTFPSNRGPNIKKKSTPISPKV